VREIIVSEPIERAWITSEGLDCSIKTNYCVYTRSHSISHALPPCSRRFDNRDKLRLAWEMILAYDEIIFFYSFRETILEEMG